MRSAAEPLLVLGPHLLKPYVDTYRAEVEPLSFDFIDCEDLTHDDVEHLRPTLRNLGILHIRCVRVIHCPSAYAVILTGD